METAREAKPTAQAPKAQAPKAQVLKPVPDVWLSFEVVTFGTAIPASFAFRAAEAE